MEWGTLSPDHRRRPRCAVVDQVERRARDSRELALELARAAAAHLCERERAAWRGGEGERGGHGLREVVV